MSEFRWAEGSSRGALFPILNEDVWAFRTKIKGLHWTAQEVDLSRDRLDWDTRMTPDQRFFVGRQLAFFAQIDVLVLRNINANFIQEVDCLEAQFAFAAQADQECEHAESYNLQIEAVMGGAERDAALNAARDLPVVAALADWAASWTDETLPVGERLLAFAVIEGVMFCASFCALQWLRELNLLPGITEFNSFISRDEAVHTALDCLLVRAHLRTPVPPARAAAIVASAVAVVDAFVDESLPVRLIGMDAGQMRQYVRFQADFVLREMGYAPSFGAANPFRFMEKLVLNEVGKTNFFERRPTEYQSVCVAGAARLAVDDSPVEW